MERGRIHALGCLGLFQDKQVLLEQGVPITLQEEEKTHRHPHGENYTGIPSKPKKGGRKCEFTLVVETR